MNVIKYYNNQPSLQTNMSSDAAQVYKVLANAEAFCNSKRAKVLIMVKPLGRDVKSYCKPYLNGIIERMTDEFVRAIDENCAGNPFDPLDEIMLLKLQYKRSEACTILRYLMGKPSYKGPKPSFWPENVRWAKPSDLKSDEIDLLLPHIYHLREARERGAGTENSSSDSSDTSIEEPTLENISGEDEHSSSDGDMIPSTVGEDDHSSTDSLDSLSDEASAVASGVTPCSSSEIMASWNEVSVSGNAQQSIEPYPVI